MQIINGLRLFDLGNHRNTDTLFGHDLMNAVYVFPATYKGKSNNIYAQIQGKTKVSLILLGQCGKRNGRPRKVDAFIV